MHFRIQQIQVGIFLSTIDTTSLLRVASYAIDAVKGLSGVDPVLLPFPSDAPPEIARITMKNERTGWGFDFAPARYDVFRYPSDASADDFLSILSTMQGALVTLWNTFERELGARAFRLALIITLSAEVEGAAAKVKEDYFSSKIDETVQEAQVHYLHVETVEDFSINFWTRIVGASKQQNQSEAVVMLLDINTVSELPLEIVNDATIANFLRIAGKVAFDRIKPQEAE